MIDALAKVGFSPALQTRLTDTEAKKARLEAERALIDAEPDDVPVLPPVEELKERARAEVGRLAFDDPAFGRLMTALVPRVEVLPYRPLDGGAVVLRAHAVVTLAPLGGPSARAAVGGLINRKVTVDLFDPPQRVAFREQVVALRAAGLSERAAAGQLRLTVTAAQRAMALHRLMTATGATDPYVRLTTPAEGEGRFRRHRHARYDFRPLPGYPAALADPA